MTQRHLVPTQTASERRLHKLVGAGRRLNVSELLGRDAPEGDGGRSSLLPTPEPEGDGGRSSLLPTPEPEGDGGRSSLLPTPEPIRRGTTGRPFARTSGGFVPVPFLEEGEQQRGPSLFDRIRDVVGELAPSRFRGARNEIASKLSGISIDEEEGVLPALARGLFEPVSPEELQIRPGEDPLSLLNLFLAFPPGAAIGEAGPLLKAVLGVGDIRPAVSEVASSIRPAVQATKRVTERAKPFLRKLATDEAGTIRIPPDLGTLKGVDKELKNIDDAIETARRVGADDASLRSEQEALVQYRRNLLEGDLSEEELLRLDELEQAIPRREAALEVGVEEARAHPAFRFYKKLIQQVGDNRGEPVTDAIAKKNFGQGFDELAQELGYERGTVPGIGIKPGFLMAPDEALKHDLREIHKLVSSQASERREVRTMVRELRGLEKGSAQVGGEVRLPAAEAGKPEAGVQAGSLGVADKAVTPKGKGAATQVSLDDQLKLQQARGAKQAPSFTDLSRAINDEETRFLLDNPAVLEQMRNTLITKGEATRNAATDPSIKALRPTPIEWLPPDEMNRLGDLNVVASIAQRSGAKARVVEKRAARLATAKRPVTPEAPSTIEGTLPTSEGVPPGGFRAVPKDVTARRTLKAREPLPQTDLPSGKKPGGPGGKPPGGPPTDPYGQLQSALEPEQESFLSKLRASLPQDFYDRNFPLKELQARSGIPARDLTQIVPGAVSAGEDIVQRFYAPIVRTVAKDIEFLEKYMVLKRMEDILARNPHARLPGGIDGWSGLLKAQDTLQEIVGPERYAAIEQAASDLWQLNTEHALQALLDEGIISAEHFTAMKVTHPHYIPFQRADFTDNITKAFVTRPEANVSTQGIKKMGLEGSERTLADPLQKLLQEPIKIKSIIFRNRASRSIVEALIEMRKRTGEELVKFIDPKRELRLAERVTGEAKPRLNKGEISQDFDTISYFENGRKHRVEVPAIYARVAKGLEAEPDNFLLKAARIANAPLRFGATTYNPLFLPVNVMRDAMSAMFREKVFPFGPDYIAGLWAVIRKNSTFSEAAQSGALLSGVVENMRPGRALKTPLGGISVRNPLDAALLLPRLVEEANVIAERATRVGVFRKLRAEGLDTLTAALRTRDATVDFAKSGHYMRVINQVIPFSNAAVQGSANMLRTVRDHPVRATVMAGIFTVPTIMTRVNNMRFETSSLIPDYEYTRNWVVQMGEGERADRTKFPIYVKIPKGEIASMLTFPAEAMFNLARNNEDRSAVDLLLTQGLQALRTVSPIDPAEGTLGLLPPGLQTGAGVATGVDPFTRAPIVPRSEQRLLPEQQFGEETGKLAVALGRQFKISPRLLNFAIEDFAAGTGQIGNWLLSLGMEAAGFEPETFGTDVADPQPEGAEAVSRVPGVRRFIGTRDTQEQRRGWELFNDAIEDTNREFAEIPGASEIGLRLGEAGSTLNILSGASGSSVELTPGQRAIYQQGLGDTITPGIREFMANLPEGQDPSQRQELVRKEMTRLREEAREKVIDTIDWSNNPEAEPMLRDRQILKFYTVIGEDFEVVDPTIARLWDFYLTRAPEEQKRRMRDIPAIAELVRRRDREREAVREGVPAIDVALVRWYGLNPKTEQGRAVFEEEQGFPFEERGGTRRRSSISDILGRPNTERQSVSDLLGREPEPVGAR